MAVKVFPVWNEVDDFLTSSPTLQQILDFHPSESAQARLRELLTAKLERTLTPEEEAELNETQAVEMFMQRLKVRALAKLDR